MNHPISRKLYSALLLPLKENLEIDETGLRTLVRHHLKNPEFRQRGGLVANPEAGEIFYMTREEKRRTLEIVLEEAGGQVPVIAELLGALGIPVIGAPGHEADDVIGTLATREAGPVDVVTGDRDLFQLVDDSRPVRILYTARGVARAEVIDEAAVTAKYDIPGRSYAPFAALRGDPSDGLPGVKGVGEKTAASLVRLHGDIAGVLAAARAGEGMSASVAAKVLAAADYLAVAPRVVDVVRDLDLPEVDGSLAAVPADPERVVELADRWNVASAVNRVLVAAAR